MHRVGRRLERLEDFRFEGRLHECIEFNVCHAADAAQASFFLLHTPPKSTLLVQGGPASTIKPLFSPLSSTGYIFPSF